jgi:hypothetical protein
MGFENFVLYLGRGLKQRFEYWTCGSFSPEAKSLLEKAAAKTTKYEIRYKDAQSIKEYAQQLQGSSLLKTLNEHYFQHALTTMEQKASRKRLKQEVPTRTILDPLEQEFFEE